MYCYFLILIFFYFESVFFLSGIPSHLAAESRYFSSLFMAGSTALWMLAAFSVS
jgi:hypothetical protein